MADEPEKKAEEREDAPLGEEEKLERQVIEASPFARCATCHNAEGVDFEQGTLLCGRYDMRVNAEADEIPDDCPEYRRDPSKPVPPDPIDLPAAPEDPEPGEPE